MAVWCLENLEGGNLPPVTPIGQSKGGREGGVALGSPICTPNILGAGEARMGYQVMSVSKKGASQRRLVRDKSDAHMHG